MCVGLDRIDLNDAVVLAFDTLLERTVGLQNLDAGKGRNSDVEDINDKLQMVMIVM